MSHYCVAVFTNHPDDVEELLAPYNETDESYFEFTALTDEEMDKAYRRFNERHDLFESFDQYMDDYGYEQEDGVYGFYHNPNAKWDYYTLDGRDWAFELKNGETYDEDGYARKNQFVYKNHKFNKAQLTAEWKKNKKLADENEGSDPEKNMDIRFARYFMSNNPDLEGYLYKNSIEYPYAFVTPDGEWHAPGNVGWFGSSDETPDDAVAYVKEWEAYINSEENPYVNFVDCHI